LRPRSPRCRCRTSTPSPLRRARVTAEAVAAEHELVPIVVHDLREIDRGDVEGLAFGEYPDEVRSELLARPLSVRFPGGETYAELHARVLRALEEIVAARADGTVAVVSHAGPIRAALAAWLGIAGEALFRIDQRTASVNVVDWAAGTPLIRLVNGIRP
jgi:ribonuclease H / adenosylcobalamin/alpha-ribazole phosphatase